MRQVVWSFRYNPLQEQRKTSPSPLEFARSATLFTLVNAAWGSVSASTSDAGECSMGTSTSYTFPLFGDPATPENANFAVIRSKNEAAFVALCRIHICLASHKWNCPADKFFPAPLSEQFISVVLSSQEFAILESPKLDATPLPNILSFKFYRLTLVLQRHSPVIFCETASSCFVNDWVTSHNLQWWFSEPANLWW